MQKRIGDLENLTGLELENFRFALHMREFLISPNPRGRLPSMLPRNNISPFGPQAGRTQLWYAWSSDATADGLYGSGLLKPASAWFRFLLDRLALKVRVWLRSGDYVDEYLFSQFVQIISFWSIFLRLRTWWGWQWLIGFRWKKDERTKKKTRRKQCGKRQWWIKMVEVFEHARRQCWVWIESSRRKISRTFDYKMWLGKKIKNGKIFKSRVEK